MHKYQQIRWIRFIPLLFVVTGVPLALDAIPPNPIYGVRTAATLASPESWYRANFWSGWTAIILGASGILVNLVADRAARLTLDQKMWVVVLTPLAIALTMATVGFIAD